MLPDRLPKASWTPAIPLAIAATGLFAAALLTARPTAHAKCETPRPLTDEESAFVREGRRQLLGLVPEPPAGWARHALTDTATAGPLCDDPGYKPPLFVRVAATYLPSDAPELSLERRTKESAAFEARLAAALREEAEASKSGDGARLDRARRAVHELRAHPVPTPPPVPPRSSRRLDVRLQVNPTSFQTCARSAPIEVEGAAVAFRATGTTCRDRTAGDVYLAAFGTWKTRPTPSGAILAGFNEWPGPPVSRTKTHTALVEIAGDPEAIDAVLRGFDPSRLRALLP